MRHRVQLSRAQSQRKLTGQLALPCWVPSGLSSSASSLSRNKTCRTQIQLRKTEKPRYGCRKGMHLGMCDCLHVVCVRMCFCVCAHVPCSPLPHWVPWAIEQRISTSVRNLGPLPRGDSPIAADDAEDNLSGQTWGRRLQWGHQAQRSRISSCSQVAREFNAQLWGVVFTVLSQQ